jgi:hypothetical protein
MVSANGIHSNGSNGSNGHFLNCTSDYEPRPLTIDVVPTAPTPKWRDQQAAFTHHIQWVDHEGISHGLTIRSDDLQSLMADLRLVKAGIREAKKQAAESASVPGDSQSGESHSPTELTAETDVQRCRIHGVDMPRRISKRNSGHYFAHFLPDDSICYGRAPKA